MKKIVSISVMTACMLCLFANGVHAQKVKFAGTVKFHTKFEGDIDPQKHIPGDQTVTIFGNKTKTVLWNGYFISIADFDKFISTSLYNFPGLKIGHIDTIKKYDPETATVKITITESSDTKTICGYVCKRYDIKIYNVEEDEENTLFVYTTTEIGENNNINAASIPGLTGYPLYSEIESDGVKQIQEAVEVKKGKVKAVDFLVPSDYKIMPREEAIETLQRILGGGGE